MITRGQTPTGKSCDFIVTPWGKERVRLTIHRRTASTSMIIDKSEWDKFVTDQMAEIQKEMERR